MTNDSTLTSAQSVPENRLREIREYEGLSQAELAALADVSIDTISDAENRRRRVSKRIQNKLVHGLNGNPRKHQCPGSDQLYQRKDVFPNG